MQIVHIQPVLMPEIIFLSNCCFKQSIISWCKQGIWHTVCCCVLNRFDKLLSAFLESKYVSTGKLKRNYSGFLHSLPTKPLKSDYRHMLCSVFCQYLIVWGLLAIVVMLLYWWSASNCRLCSAELHVCLQIHTHMHTRRHAHTPHSPHTNTHIHTQIHTVSQAHTHTQSLLYWFQMVQQLWGISKSDMNEVCHLFTVAQYWQLLPSILKYLSPVTNAS